MGAIPGTERGAARRDVGQLLYGIRDAFGHFSLGAAAALAALSASARSSSASTTASSSPRLAAAFVVLSTTVIDSWVLRRELEEMLGDDQLALEVALALGQLVRLDLASHQLSPQLRGRGLGLLAGRPPLRTCTV